jgi:hypothetical protein
MKHSVVVQSVTQRAVWFVDMWVVSHKEVRLGRIWDGWFFVRSKLWVEERVAGNERSLDSARDDG